MPAALKQAKRLRRIYRTISLIYRDRFVLEPEGTGHCQSSAGATGKCLS